MLPAGANATASAAAAGAHQHAAQCASTALPFDSHRHIRRPSKSLSAAQSLGRAASVAPGAQRALPRQLLHKPTLDHRPLQRAASATLASSESVRSPAPSRNVHINAAADHNRATSRQRSATVLIKTPAANTYHDPHQPSQPQHDYGFVAASSACTLHTIRVRESSPSPSPAARTHTMQSIHSLSMQLNTANSSATVNHHQQSPSPIMADVSSAPQPHQQQAGSSLLNSNKLTRLVGKKASRFKELVLQNLGRADKTHDELFQLYEHNFYKQQAHALKLHKEFRLYVNSLKGTHDTAKSLNACIQQSTGDYQSARHDLVCENLSQLDHLSTDLLEKLRDQVLVSINEYLLHFGELRDKIAKRRRKLIDYDSSRRAYELMLANVNKKRIRMQQQQHQQQNQHQPHPDERQAASIGAFRSAFMLSSSSRALNQSESNLQLATSQLIDEARLLKMREQYNYCKIMYETINSDLHEELPLVYEKKMKHLLMTLQNYFSLEAQFSSNASKLYATISDVVDELPMSIMHHHTRSDAIAQERELATAYHNKVVAASGGSSSGMGSSRGDSSLESSSSPDNDDSQSASPACEHRRPEDQSVAASGQVGELAASTSNATKSIDHGVSEVAVIQEQCNDDDQDEHVVDDDVDDDDDNDDGDEGQRDDEDHEVRGDNVDEDIEEGCNVDANKLEKQGDSRQATSRSAPKELAPECAPKQPEVEPIYVVGHTKEQQGASEGSSILSPNGGATVDAVVAINKGDEPAKRVDENSADEQLAEQKQEIVVVIDAANTSAPKPAKKINEMSTFGVAKAIKNINSGKEMVPRECLYKVKTDYKYLAEDVDELCFEADEIIQVIAFDESQEQEEGWLMGVRETNGQRGLFPANFTRPI